MGVLDRLRRALAPERRDAAAGMSLPGISALGPFAVGAAIDARAAENLAVVTGCVNAVSSAIATLPVLVYRTLPDGSRVEAPDHPVARLLRRPNPHQTQTDLFEWITAQILLHGNALLLVGCDGAGRVNELTPIPWPNVSVSVLPSGRLCYDVTQITAPWGGTGATRRLLDDEVFHAKDRSDCGYVGRSRLSRAPAVLANALALQAYASAQWQHGTTLSGLLKAPGRLSKEAAERIGESWRNTYAGVQNARRVAVLEEGLEFQPISVSPEDAEVLASRKFSVEELCRVFGVPPPLVQSYENNTFTNAQQAGLWFAQFSLAPLARKIEAEFSRSVFGEGSDCFIEIDLSGLTRGDFPARWASYETAISRGILTPDEVRQTEGWNVRARPAAEPDGAD